MKVLGSHGRIYLDPCGFKTLPGFANQPTEVQSLFARRKDFSEPVAETDVVETKVAMGIFKRKELAEEVFED